MQNTNQSLIQTVTKVMRWSMSPAQCSLNKNDHLCLTDFLNGTFKQKKDTNIPDVVLTYTHKKEQFKACSLPDIHTV